MSVALTLDSRPALWRLARLEYDPVRQRHVLLYPEGAVLLNETGGAILELLRRLADDRRRSSRCWASAIGTDVTRRRDRVSVGAGPKGVGP